MSCRKDVGFKHGCDITKHHETHRQGSASGPLSIWVKQWQELLWPGLKHELQDEDVMQITKMTAARTPGPEVNHIRYRRVFWDVLVLQHARPVHSKQLVPGWKDQEDVLSLIWLSINLIIDVKTSRISRTLFKDFVITFPSWFLLEAWQKDRHNVGRWQYAGGPNRQNGREPGGNRSFDMAFWNMCAGMSVQEKEKKAPLKTWVRQGLSGSTMSWCGVQWLILHRLPWPFMAVLSSRLLVWLRQKCAEACAILKMMQPHRFSTESFKGPKG